MLKLIVIKVHERKRDWVNKKVERCVRAVYKEMGPRTPAVGAKTAIFRIDPSWRCINALLYYTNQIE